MYISNTYSKNANYQYNEACKKFRTYLESYLFTLILNFQDLKFVLISSTKPGRKNENCTSCSELSISNTLFEVLINKLFICLKKMSLLDFYHFCELFWPQAFVSCYNVQRAFIKIFAIQSKHKAVASEHYCCHKQLSQCKRILLRRFSSKWI